MRQWAHAWTVAGGKYKADPKDEAAKSARASFDALGKCRSLAHPQTRGRSGTGGPMMKRLILGVTESLVCGLLFLAGHYVRDARLRRRLTAAPVESGSEFEFPARLELREIVCDDPDVEVATVVCNLP